MLLAVVAMAVGERREKEGREFFFFFGLFEMFFLIGGDEPTVRSLPK